MCIGGVCVCDVCVFVSGVHVCGVCGVFVGCVCGVCVSVVCV